MEDRQNDDEKQDSLVKKDKSGKHLITFAKINKYFLIPFLCPVACMVANLFLQFIIDSNVVIKKELVLPIYVVFSYIFTGLLYFVTQVKEKVDKTKEEIIYRERPSTAIKFIYNERSIKSNLKQWILIIFLGFLCFLFEFFAIMCHGKHVFEERLYFLFFIPLFSKIILKDNIFRHQYLSLGIAIIGLVLLFIPVGFQLESDDLIPNILTFFCGIGYSLFLVIIKYEMHVFYISPLKLSLFIGLFSLGFGFFGFFFYSLIVYHDLSYFKNSLDFTKADSKWLISLYIIACLLFATILQTLAFLVVFYFSPILLMVTDIISPMLLWIASTIMKPVDFPDVLLYPIGYLIVLFSSLIYNEIIIFNFCDLNKDTKIFVEQRINEETTDIRKTENDIKLGSFERSDEGSNDPGSDEDRHSNSSL